jgi:molybdopterin converting factor small subunit
MKLTIKLLPPYRKNGAPGEELLQIEDQAIDLQGLAAYLSREWKDKLGYALIDQHDLLTAEFMVNGRHAPLKTVLSDGDRVTVIPYLGGG